jgi:hypothetical protein
MRLAHQVVASVLFALPLAAQATIDEGSFTFYVNGERVGREQFSIKKSQTGGTVTLLARATILLEGRRLESTLRTDTTGQPLEFLLDEYAAGSLRTRVKGDAAAGRFSQRVVNLVGQSEKEFRLAPGTVVSDSEMVHQYYFFVRSRAAGRVPVLIPRRLGRDSVTLTVRADGPTVDLGNGALPARHLIVTDAAGNATDLWVDPQGRVLRVAIQSRGFVAVRDEPPG